MKFDEIQEPLLNVLRQGNGMFRTAYQIFANLGQETKTRLTGEYPVVAGRPVMGAGAGIYYSPASFIAHALANFAKSNNRIIEGALDSQNAQFEGYEPGFKGTISIWAWK
jgi:hypothetical protein